MHTERFTLTQKNVLVTGNSTITICSDSRVKNGVIPLGGEADAIAVQVAPVGATLDEFVLQGRVNPSAGWAVMKNAAGTWGTATAAMPVTTGTIDTTADAGTAFFIYDVRGLDAIRFQASSNTTAVTTLTVYVAVRMAV